MNSSRPFLLIIVIGIVAASIYFLNSRAPRTAPEVLPVPVVPQVLTEKDTERSQRKLQKYELAKEITTPDGFINTDGKPLTISELVGKKVILVDFWTYSCINCQRTTPYLNSWYEKYKDKGFVIVGVHTPEFEFEKNYENVKVATEKMGIKYPVVLDNDYSTWLAYENRYWPRKYLIDIDGYVVYDHIGEGGYEETEKHIQEALKERMEILGEKTQINDDLTKDTSSFGGFVRSPETYFGSWRNSTFGNGKSGTLGPQVDLVIPSSTKINKFYLSGDWNFSDQFAENISSDAKLIYRYLAKDIFLVAKSNNEVEVEVLRNGNPLGSEAGSDIIRDSNGRTFLKIKDARLYKIIQGDKAGGGALEFRFKKPGVDIFTFTFG
jgi:thiol-disulfide isomerase/thioredoxin